MGQKTDVGAGSLQHNRLAAKIGTNESGLGGIGCGGAVVSSCT
jgi:hypothetical protein